VAKIKKCLNVINIKTFQLLYGNITGLVHPSVLHGLDVSNWRTKRLQTKMMWISLRAEVTGVPTSH